MKQQALYKISGMMKDIADSAMDKQHAFDIRNMRLSHDDRNIFSALVNEPGTIKARDKNGNLARIKGTVIGFNTLNDTGILFTHEEDGVIYDSVSDGGEMTPSLLSATRPAPEHPLLDFRFCSYSFRINNGTIGTGNRSMNISFDHTGGGEVTIVLYIDSLTYPEEYEDTGIQVAVVQGDASLYEPDSQQAQQIINKTSLEALSGNGYYLTIKLPIPPAKQSVTQHLHPIVSIIPAGTIDNGSSTFMLEPVDFNFAITIPAVEAGGTTESGTMENEVESIVPVDRDLPYELSQKTCDHIYLIETEKRDTISEYGDDTAVIVTEYFRGDLNFDSEHPIESTVYFENDEVKKIYWVDGINQMRYANIADLPEDGYWTNNLMFDSVPQLHLQEDVTVVRNSTGGVFPSCTVQFAFTYLNRYGAESNIAWISPIYYSSPDDRGGAPDEICSNSFTINIRRFEADGRFDYIRLYHIVRTTLDTEVEVRRVADIAIPEWYETISYTDTNTVGESVDPTELLYLGGTSIIPYTLEQKSNTLFLGNLTQNYEYLRDLDFSSYLGWGDNDWPESDGFFNPVESNVPCDVFSGYYSHENQLRYGAHQITTFRRGEDYRLGFQAQDNTGRWSDVWWLGDYCNNSAYPVYADNMFIPVHAKFTLSEDIVRILRDAGYRKARPVVVFPEPWERNIYTEGLMNPTLYNVKDRASNAPFAQSSWFLRPFSPIDMGSFHGMDVVSSAIDSFGNYSGVVTTGGVSYTYKMPFPETGAFIDLLDDGNNWSEDMPTIALESTSQFDYSGFGSWAEFRHNHPLGDSQQRNGEIQSLYNSRAHAAVKVSDSDRQSLKFESCGYTLTFPYVDNDTAVVFNNKSREFITKAADFFYVDQSILDMYSADIEFDQSFQATPIPNAKLRVVGFVPISSFISSYNILTNTPPNKFYNKDNNSLIIPQGFYGSEIVGAVQNTQSGHGWKSFISAPVWHDDVAYSTVEKHDGGNPKYRNDNRNPVGFAVYPWQGTGSLNNDTIGSRKTYPANGGDDEESKSLTGDNYISAELKYKTIANLHYSYRTHYIDSLSSCIDVPAEFSIFLDTQNVSLTKVHNPHEDLSVLHYFGNVDKLITPATSSFASSINEDVDDPTVSTDSSKDYPFTRQGGYPRFVSFKTYRTYSSTDPAHDAFKYPYTPMDVFNVLPYQINNLHSTIKTHTMHCLKEGSDRSMSAIPIKYNSCNHIVVALDYVSDYQKFFNWGGNTESSAFSRTFDGQVYYWPSNDGLTGVKECKLFSLAAAGSSEPSVWSSGFDNVAVADRGNYRRITFDGVPSGYLYLGQICRTSVVPNKFGGTSEEALEQNMWLPAGEAVYLEPEAPAVLEWSVGDTYYQRYDALRTYPQTEEDMNKIIDIVSFMTETHTNIDGRYDTNRGLTDNLYVRPKNFNKLNYVYSQKDNFFVYHTLNTQKVHLDTFKYSFTWTISKIAGSLRDEWTRITLANSYDCDGNKGELTRISRLDNMLVAFQSNGVAQILFDENVQLQGSEGTPIELANSGKMQGLRYYTTEVGCQNKWSINVAPDGIYFIDGKSKSLYSIGGEGIKNISRLCGMSSWFLSRQDLFDVWNPHDWKGFFSHWDATTGELMITSGDTCLCYDTTLGVFSSFYDYQKTDAMFTLDDTVLTVHGDDSVLASSTHRYDHIWLHRKNEKQYCRLFNKQRESSIEVICNSNNDSSDYGMTKIFDNMTWRADAWSVTFKNNDKVFTYAPFITFDSMNGYDDYQKFRISFDMTAGNKQSSTPGTPINLRKKFKQWHTTVPRAGSWNASGTAWIETRDRICDTWCHIKLSLSKDVSMYRHILHDLVISYFIP